MAVNFFGPSETSDGIGRAAALNLSCLRDTGFPVKEYVLSRPVALQKDSNLTINDALLSELPYNINYFHFSARWVPHYFAQLSAGSLRSFYNIGYWVCEVPVIPELWAKQLRYFNEIWTASSFCQQAISRKSNVPVLRIPHPIESRSVTDRIKNRLAGMEIGPLTFLLIANVYSDAERKNVLFAIRAFLKAFNDSQDVKFIVKVSNLENDPNLETTLLNIASTYPNIELVPGYVEDERIRELYAGADALVSLHRAEGFGFSISDAIARGIPTISTGYSGNMDFCSSKDGILVDYKLREIGHERLRYKSSDVWAEPDMESAVLAFLKLRSTYHEHLKLAQVARQRVQQDFSCDAVTELMRERIGLIRSQFNYANDLDGRNLDRRVEVEDKYGF